MHLKRHLLPILATVAIAGGAIFLFLKSNDTPRRDPSFPRRIPIAVLGDSDSHIYRDPLNGVHRGGKFHAVTFQWTEILDALRPSFFDFGPKRVWGSRYLLARINEKLGLEARTPPKFDYRYNYALSGLGCNSLLDDWPQQARWLIDQIKLYPAFWTDGIVVIRIGVNDIGQEDRLKGYAEPGLTDEVREKITGCTHRIAQAHKSIRNAHKSIRMVIVGIADETPFHPSLSSKEAQTEIQAVLDYFDGRLAQIAAADADTVFMDDRTWFRHLRHGNEINTISAATQTEFVRVRIAKGDHPRNAMLLDGHAGTLINGLWARELIHLLNAEFKLEIPPLRDTEINRIADPDNRLGIAPINERSSIQIQ